ncbi:MAG: BON domain-containing protein [Planctomycetes bacterium]|nr:BON domain-containing protein [Planctomycetota bacterium]
METINHTATLFAADDRLRERIISSFARLPLPLHRLVRIEVNQGVVHLRGQVRSYYEKQLAYAISRRVPGVKEVVDRVAVTYPVSSHQAAPVEAAPRETTLPRRTVTFEAYAPRPGHNLPRPEPKAPAYTGRHVKLDLGLDLEEYLSERAWPVAG